MFQSNHLDISKAVADLISDFPDYELPAYEDTDLKQMADEIMDAQAKTTAALNRLIAENQKQNKSTFVIMIITLIVAILTLGVSITALLIQLR